MSTTTQGPETLPVTRRTFVKATGALAAVLAVSSQVQLFKPTPAHADSTETISYSAHRTGVVRVHVKDGRWYKSSAVKPNLQVGQRALALRNRTYEAERVLYPMKRVGWAPGGTSSVANRGKGEFVRISWEEAYTSIVSEIKRIYATYGPSAMYGGTSGHQWPGALQSGESWAKRPLAAMGGYTNKAGGESFTGWNDACYLSWGTSMPNPNSFADLVANSKMIVYWGVDHGIRGWQSSDTPNTILRYKAAGVKIVVVDPIFNKTASFFADKHISVVTGTDEAMLAAIAYVWIQAGTYDQAWLDSHTIGFDEAHLPAGAPANSSFKSYILGLSDGIPKTPAWAEAITSVPRQTITAFAQEWASKPTFVDSYSGGAQRRANAGQFVRMLITVCAMQGLGISGRGLGHAMWTTSLGGTSNSGLASVGGAPANIANPVTQLIQHRLFPDAILDTTKSVSWTTGHSNITGAPATITYPAPGYSRIKAYYGAGGSDLGQRPGGTFKYAQAFSKPEIEFIGVQVADWTGMAFYADIVLPSSYLPENEDIIAWRNYVVYNKPAIPRPGEAKSDMEIAIEIARRLGVTIVPANYAGGPDLQSWLAYAFTTITPKTSTALNAQPATYEDFKAVGYLEFPTPDLPASLGGLANFNTDPVKNPLTTPSGKLEIYSQQIAAFWGPNDPTAPPIPKYVPSPENRLAARASTYPLEFMTAHPYFGEHSQYHHLSWARDEDSTMINGYQSLWMNPVDAAARGIKQGDAVRLFNDRGQTLYGAFVTEIMKPGYVLGWDGGNWRPMQPGVLGSLDLGAAANDLTATAQNEPICDGMNQQALVQMEKWGGA